MQKKAHITCRPGASVGDEVVGLCGKVFTMDTVWDEIPKKHPICRKCVDTALAALTDADRIIESARVCTAMVSRRVTILAEVMDDSVLDGINERDHDHLDELAERLKEARALKTCTCTWDSPEVMTEDPDCPVHRTSIGPGGRPMQDVELPSDE